eukprot:m.54421 g.54421  ORF g.54421 m.54421 type:complete len:608 (-) comp10925_c0_seq1:271-2094(-)
MSKQVVLCLSLVLLIAITLGNAEDNNVQIYIELPQCCWSNQSTTNGFSGELRGVSSSSCTSACGMLTQCTGVAYSNTSQTCTLLSHDLVPLNSASSNMICTPSDNSVCMIQSATRFASTSSQALQSTVNSDTGGSSSARDGPLIAVIAAISVVAFVAVAFACFSMRGNNREKFGDIVVGDGRNDQQVAMNPMAHRPITPLTQGMAELGLGVAPIEPAPTPSAHEYHAIDDDKNLVAKNTFNPDYDAASPNLVDSEMTRKVREALARAEAAKLNNQVLENQRQSGGLTPPVVPTRTLLRTDLNGPNYDTPVPPSRTSYAEPVSRRHADDSRRRKVASYVDVPDGEGPFSGNTYEYQDRASLGPNYDNPKPKNKSFSSATYGRINEDDGPTYDDAAVVFSEMYNNVRKSMFLGGAAEYHTIEEEKEAPHLTHEERLAILKRVAAGKISVEEAEQEISDAIQAKINGDYHGTAFRTARDNQDDANRTLLTPGYVQEVMKQNSASKKNGKSHAFAARLRTSALSLEDQDGEYQNTNEKFQLSADVVGRQGSTTSIMSGFGDLDEELNKENINKLEKITKLKHPEHRLSVESTVMGFEGIDTGSEYNSLKSN